MIKPDLFLLHYAGGNIYSFNFIKPYLKRYYNLIPLELPGRGKRIREKLLFDEDLAVEDILNQMLNHLSDNPFLVWGHSMGAKLGFLVINELEKRKLAPLGFLATGNPGPNIKSGTQRYDLPKQEFISELKTLGGIGDEVIENEDLFNFFEPIIRADFEIVEKESSLSNNVKISTPIFACMGDEEEHCDKIENWQQYTTNRITSRLLKGNHFFIYDHVEEIVKLIRRCSK